MKRLVTLFLLLGFLLPLAQAQILEPVQWTFKSEKVSKTEYDLIFSATIEDEWHLYSNDLPPGGPMATVISYESTDGFELLGDLGVSPVPEDGFDEDFQMQVKYHSYSATFTQRIKVINNSPINITGEVSYQACNDETCVPGYNDFEFKLGETEQTTDIVASDKSSGKTKIDPYAPVDLGSKSLWGLFFIAFLAGLIALLTPCVFPMIPMTVSFFMHGGKNKRKSLFEAVFFGLSIIAIYTIIGTLVAILFGPGVANFFSTHWIPNVFFFLIFMFFAAWFFGMFEINLPNWMVSKSDKRVDKGGIGGPFFMAFTLVLVSFSCTGPIVGTILVESAGGAVLEPIIGMLGFSIAFALPFTLFAIFPSWLSNMPKSGGWLNSVKVVLGFIEIALGLKFLSIADQTYHWGILDREVYLALWIVIFAMMGFYLLGKLKFKLDSDTNYISVPRLLMSLVTFAFVVYMIPGMFGAPLKALSGYLPPMSTHDFDIHEIIRNNAGTGGISEAENSICEKPKHSDQLHLPHGLLGYFDYDQGLACAKSQNKPVFIDFTGHGCVNCRQMEDRVWGDPRVLKRLREDFILIALYVDDKNIKLPEDEWVISSYDGKVKKTLGKKYQDFQITRFNQNSQPLYVLLDTKGEPLVPPRSYNLDVEAFIDFLDSGLKEFTKK
ncbi:MAG: cytochrome c biogenesis protein CcdA [Bacteroidota bacterium]|nr:cytochrome c biogenesis protein CcdA [Bacteroidota bacterium]